MSGQAPCNNRPLAPDDKTTDIPDFITCGGCRIWLIRQAVLSRHRIDCHTAQCGRHGQPDKQEART